MTVGLSTYAFFWQWQAVAERPLSLVDMIDRTAAWGVERFQICDYPRIESYDEGQLAELRWHAERRGVALELGTRGIRPEHLRRYLRLAGRLNVSLVRSMFNTVDHKPSKAEATALLKTVMPHFERSGVTLALETYEQVPVRVLVDTVEAVNSPRLGICLDPANSVAALEHPKQTIDVAAPHVRNIHVKDFAFTRTEGWVGFVLAGCPLGEGLLDYDYMVDTVRPGERGIDQIIEHWLPWQGDPATTAQTENEWTLHNLDYLRSKGSRS
jgi:sugar phosphate isomerase/epimerase